MVFNYVSQLISPFERIRNFEVPTNNSNFVPKVPNAGDPFWVKSPIGSKINVKDFQKQLYEPIACLIRSKKYQKIMIL